jgi:hypothetical protein
MQQYFKQGGFFMASSKQIKLWIASRKKAVAKMGKEIKKFEGDLKKAVAKEKAAPKKKPAPKKKAAPKKAKK